MKKLSAYFFGLLSLSLVFWFWWSNSGFLMLGDRSDIFVSLGRLTGLLAAYLVLWELLLIGRQPWLERIFGLDRLADLHHWNGLFCWLFIVLHPIFLSLGYGLVSNQNAWKQFLDFLLEWDDLIPAFVGTLIFVIAIVLSVITIKKHLKYEFWYFVHLTIYLAIIMTFGHQLELGYDLQDRLFAIYWYLLYAGVVISLLYFRFWLPAYNFYRHRFCVSQIVKENKDNISIYISGRNLEGFHFLAGQFFSLRFLNKYYYQSHPFSVSSVPGRNYLRFTVKYLGDFTDNLEDKIKVGDPVVLEGPYGLFISKRAKHEKTAYLAGGVGITPIRPLIEESLGEKDGVLLFANNTEEDAIFKEELDDLVAKSNDRLRVVQIWRQGQGCESGFIDEEKIIRLIPDYLERDFYICGPLVMRRVIVKTLKKLKVSASSIHFEKFSWH